jgi:hypothetical protein
MKNPLLASMLVLLLVSCAGNLSEGQTQANSDITLTETFTPDIAKQETILAQLSTATNEGEVPDSLQLDPMHWQEWPVIPIVTENAREIFLRGQELGNDPHAFSIFADCLSLPRAFLGAYDNNPVVVAALPPDLQETVAWFTGSFYRENPTVKSGTTVASLLWWGWHENKYGCLASESPVQCELRIHKPSIVIIQIGTHSVDRNKEYMGEILEQLIAAGVVPIIGTKADNTEKDMHVNLEYAELAAYYDIPLWNFWAAVQSLPNHGLHLTEEDPALYLGDLYLTDEAKELHRLTALESLEAVWRGVSVP